MLTESIALGLIVGFFFYEGVGYSPGGLVVPGYIALYLDRPLVVLATLITALLVYGAVSVLSRIAIVYSRRRFLLMVITGFGFQWFFEQLFSSFAIAPAELQTIGYIIPGLIANDMDRQRAIPTLSSLIVVSIVVRLILIILGYPNR